MVLTLVFLNDKTNDDIYKKFRQVLQVLGLYGLLVPMEHPYNSQPFGYVFRQAYMIRFVIFKFLHEESRVVRLTGFGIPDLPSDLRQHREAMLPDYKSDKGETLGKFKSVARLTVPESERCIFFLKTYSCGDESGRRKYEDMLVKHSWAPACIDFSV